MYVETGKLDMNCSRFIRKSPYIDTGTSSSDVDTLNFANNVVFNREKKQVLWQDWGNGHTHTERERRRRKRHMHCVNLETFWNIMVNFCVTSPEELAYFIKAVWLYTATCMTQSRNFPFNPQPPMVVGYLGQFVSALLRFNWAAVAPTEYRGRQGQNANTHSL